ncbi:MAG: heavy metal-binding domain-containing protein, partial [Verrucomicrobiota bacterium]
MCPGVESDAPGDCPKCGMALERNPAWVAPAGGAEDDDGELRDMTQRFRVGAVLTLPVFVLAMSHLIPALARQPWVAGDV